MGLFSKDIKTLDDLFLHHLQDIYYAEKQILKSLPTMIEKASDPTLKQGLDQHHRETMDHATRIEQVFSMLGKQPKAVDARRSTASSRRPKRSQRHRRQAGARRRHHRRGAGGRALRDHTLRLDDRLGEQLGPPDVANVLKQNLEQEKAADKKLTTLAESSVNRRAA